MEPFMPLTIEDKPLFDRHLAVYRPQASELSFTNLFMWRHKYRFHHLVLEGFLWVLNISAEGAWYFSPPLGPYDGNLKNSVEALLDILRPMNRPLIIKKADRPTAEALRLIYPDSLLIDEVRNDFDYLYDYESLKTLKGNLYHKKRNHVHRFLRACPDWTYEPLTPGNRAEVMACLDRWCAYHECSSDPDLGYERRAIHEALNHMESLNFNGGLIRIHQQVEAFSLAERLNPDTTVIHIEKADPRIEGLYAAMNQFYLEHCPQPTQWVNREQDMGLEGLRKSKLSYHPAGFVEKYTLRFEQIK